MIKDNKFLLHALEGLNQRQIFFLVWAVIVAAFVLLMISFYRKNTRRNFRSPAQGPGRPPQVDARKLSDLNEKKSVIQIPPNRN